MQHTVGQPIPDIDKDDLTHLDAILLPILQHHDWIEIRYLVDAFRALYGELLLTESAHTLELREDVEAGSISADALVSLPPEGEAYRDYALDVVKAWCHSPKSYSEVASLLTRRRVPTPDGKTMWRHN